MAKTPLYDEIADWYEGEFLPGVHAQGDPLEYGRLVTELLGPGRGRLLEVGCGTGDHSARFRDLGWTPVGIDLSARMLAYGKARLPAARADAERMPIADGAVAAAATMMVHTDMPGYAAVLREVARVLEPGGVLLHVGVHPCFCGGFADWSDRPRVLIEPGYLEGDSWTRRSYTTQGVRDKVGAAHFPLPQLLHMVTDAGLTLQRFGEGGTPIPTVLAFRARKPG
ncbi:MAG TPA: class I SAM-dependent methyltransferase [Mycobacteriales bacterium]